MTKKFTVRRGRRYQAQISLGFFQQFASNEQIAQKFTAVGFSDVVVSGSGRTRVARGLWPSDEVSAEIPSEVHDIVQVEVA